MTDQSKFRCVITGAASGIGRATALHLAERGVAVFAGDVNADGLAALVDHASGIGHEIRTAPVDVADRDSVANFIETAAASLAGLDGLVNVAGVQRSGQVVDFDVETWDEQMAVNVRSCFLTTKFAIPHLAKSTQASIVSTASLAAYKGVAGAVGYCASKGAITSFTHSLAVELAPQDIRVNCICPAWTDTSFNDPVTEIMGGRESVERFVRDSVPMKRQATPQEIATHLAFLLLDATYMTGQAMVVDGGLRA